MRLCYRCENLVFRSVRIAGQPFVRLQSDTKQFRGHDRHIDAKETERFWSIDGEVHRVAARCSFVERARR